MHALLRMSGDTLEFKRDVLLAAQRLLKLLFVTRKRAMPINVLVVHLRTRARRC